MKVAIPRFGEDVAPCFEYSATISIFTIGGGGRVVEQTDFTLQSKRIFDRLRLLRDQDVDTLICGGVQDQFEDAVQARGIRVISWVCGNVDELLDLFVHGKLTPGEGRLGRRNRRGDPGQ